MDIVASLLEKLISLDKSADALDPTENGQPVASTIYPSGEDPTASSQRAHAHTDGNTIPASESLPSSVEGVSDEGVVDAVQAEAAASTPSKLISTQQQGVEPVPATSTHGGSKRRGKGPKATPAAKKRKAQQLQDEAGNECPAEELAHVQSQSMPAPSARKPAGNIEEHIARVDAESAKERTQEAAGIQIHAVAGPAADGKPKLASLEVITEDMKTAVDTAAEQERGTASCDISAEDVSQPAGSSAAKARTSVEADDTAQQQEDTQVKYPAEAAEELRSTTVCGQQAPLDSKEVPNKDDVAQPEGSRIIAETSELPAPVQPMEPTPQPVSVQRAEISPVNPAASPIKPNVEVEGPAREHPTPACQTELLPALDAAPDATMLQVNMELS